MIITFKKKIFHLLRYTSKGVGATKYLMYQENFKCDSTNIFQGGRSFFSKVGLSVTFFYDIIGKASAELLGF